MADTHETVGTPALGAPVWRRSRIVVAVIILICYSALLYALTRPRLPPVDTNEPPMFGPVISEIGEKRAGITSKGVAPAPADESLVPPQHWSFAPIDIWPSPPQWTATLSEFTPVGDARPDPAEADPSRNIPPSRRSKLQMVRWLRPEYRMEWAQASLGGSVLLDLLIDAHGQPTRITVARSSGSPQLDQSALRAAASWRFAPPRWNSQPAAVEARVEVRYNKQPR
jgi:TonB family protein